jgi:hypothetical protein
MRRARKTNDLKPGASKVLASDAENRHQQSDASKYAKVQNIPTIQYIPKMQRLARGPRNNAPA